MWSDKERELHINVREAMALAFAFRRWGPATFGEVYAIVDSMVLHDCIKKTWSGSFVLNVQLRIILGNPKCFVVPVYIPTQFNPADKGSRGIDVPVDELRDLVLRAFQALVAGVGDRR